jgi:ketosteroid isomerase-like protein
MDAGVDRSDLNLAERLRAIEDRLEIEELAATYCQWFDDHRWQEIVTELFADNAVFDILARVEGRDAIAAFFDEVTREGLGATWHYDMNRRICVAGDEASVESMFFVPCTRGAEPWLAAGRYTDTLRRIDGRWRYTLKRGRFDYFVPLGEGWSAGAWGFDAARRAAR